MWWWPQPERGNVNFRLYLPYVGLGLCRTQYKQITLPRATYYKIDKWKRGRAIGLSSAGSPCCYAGCGRRNFFSNWHGNQAGCQKRHSAICLSSTSCLLTCVQFLIIYGYHSTFKIQSRCEWKVGIVFLGQNEIHLARFPLQWYHFQNSNFPLRIHMKLLQTRNCPDPDILIESNGLHDQSF